MAIRHNELQPLLDHEPSLVTSAEPNPSLNNLQRDQLSPASNNCSIEFGTLPETAIFGRNLTWTSIYMLTVLRIIASGIFATPGISYRSVGSVGLAVKVWIVSALIAACGLTIPRIRLNASLRRRRNGVSGTHVSTPAVLYIDNSGC